MTEEANWKQVGDLFKTDGNVLEAGTFINSRGGESSISPADVKELYENITEPVPLAVGHGKGPIVGYAVKFANSTDYTNIYHNGIVFDDNAFTRAVMNGHTFISPEIDRQYDENGKVIHQKIARFCFVPNPAMGESMKTTVKRFAFSAPEVNEVKPMDNTLNTSGISTGSSSNPVSNQQAAPVPAAPVATPTIDVEAIVNAVTQNISTQLESALETRLEAMKSELVNINTPPKNPFIKEAERIESNQSTETISPAASEGSSESSSIPKEFVDNYTNLQVELQKYREQNEKILKKQYGEVLNELRELGFERPESMVSHLPLTDKIETLTSIKTNYVKKMPMNSSIKEPMNSEGGTNEDKPSILKTLRSLHLDSPENLKLFEKSSVIQRYGVDLQ